ncbi:radical SAM protein [uncultured Methanobrevibacter sp.]|uniref:radical SAM protein n=1 Tax=uncultured Methanobrevibacter sp. TaxID=253161 RepID=UPI0026269437
MFYEENVIKKNPLRADIRFGLVYPNVYKTAMSSLGYQILYNYINEREDSYCERIIYPSVRSLETNSPLADFDIISFSLQYEQDYFNLLKLLKESNIPLRREDRTIDDPLIIAGGPCASANPLPLSDFIDIFVIGEAEAVLDDFFEVYTKEKENDLSYSKENEMNLSENNHLNPKRDLSPFLNVNGLYISEFNNKTEIALTKKIKDIHHLTCPIVTVTDDEEFLPAFSNSILLNVSRACTRGCRFCMSSFLYRPLREVNLEILFSIAERARENTGLNKVSLIGAAVSDYFKIDELTEGLKNRGFQVSTPSMRIESITKSSLISLRESGLKTLTIAPETIYSLRRKLNKDISDDDVFRVVNDAVELGFNIKLYFLIGLPYESEENINELVELIKKIDSMKYNFNSNSKTSTKKSKVSIKFSVNPLIPKPHSPMQWESYDFKDIKKKIRYMKRNLKGIDIRFDSAKMGLVQYVLSCGDKDLSKLLEESVYRKINIREWNDYLPEYEFGDILPWDSIDVSVSKEFLEREYLKMKNDEITPWCEEGACYNCGACHFDEKFKSHYLIE